MKINKYQSIAELIEDPAFNSFLSKNIDEIRNIRNFRPEPKPGYKYKRDIIDRMMEKNQFDIHFIKSNIESVWERTSDLTMETRSAILNITKKTICDYIEAMESDMIEPE